MQADFDIVANGQNITDLLRDRLLELRLTDKTGLETDTCEIRLDDRGGKLALPPKGATLTISLGWAGQGLNLLGSFKIDEVVMDGPPAGVTIRGKGADLRQSAKSQRHAGYEKTTLAAIVATVAARHGWRAVCKVTAEVARLDQIGESDLHFLTRLARLHGATATVKNGALLVLPRGAGKTASGAVPPKLVLRAEQLTRYSFTFADRSGFKSVKTNSHDAGKAKQVEQEVANPVAADGAAVHSDRHPYTDTDTAKAAAQSRMAALNRATASGTLNLMGRADIAAERIIGIAGLKPEVDGDYLVESVTHSYTHDSWRMQVELNAGNLGKATAGQGRSANGGKELVAPG
ncbi:phage late control D family protein [Rugamonas sp. CCM 8940]|uniref:phage late control D family protein n=1 Tax=Rugamonas sp. CCM 8940 TaxID=2765359 RepID=UPI0018F2EEAC|nr:contractile injection system protein, VgrG/Pvc8 family [Rugamonas sp. CCM 8940]MBJ7309231.1 late control protein [Rugamonas sp. CCM 8940]